MCPKAVRASWMLAPLSTRRRSLRILFCVASARSVRLPNAWYPTRYRARHSVGQSPI